MLKRTAAKFYTKGHSRAERAARSRRLAFLAPQVLAGIAEDRARRARASFKRQCLEHGVPSRLASALSPGEIHLYLRLAWDIAPRPYRRQDLGYLHCDFAVSRDY